MKITRLKRGYRIRCSDSEFAALIDVFTRGEGEIEGMTEHDWKELDRDVARGLKTVSGTGSWAVEDRR